jgi:hypothetical protein
VVFLPGKKIKTQTYKGPDRRRSQRRKGREMLSLDGTTYYCPESQRGGWGQTKSRGKVGLNRRRNTGRRKEDKA